MGELAKTLSRIALRDDRFISAVARAESTELDPKAGALVKLGALIGLDGTMSSFIATVQDAQAAGASEAEIVATLVTVIPSVGVVRASSAAPKLALALGYQPDVALEENDRDWVKRPE